VKQRQPVPKGRWRNRIVGAGEEDPEQLLANPKNWRIHPRYQQEALEAVLDEVGWVDDVKVNKRTGTVIDGHLRVTLALRNNEPSIPVKYVDLSPEEEALVLATFDPLGTFAVADPDALDGALEDVSSTSAEIAGLLTKIAEDAGVIPPEEKGPPVQASIRRLATKPPPKLAWVLIGLPTVRYGEIAELVEGIAKLDGVFCETVLSDVKPEEPGDGLADPDR